MPDFTPIVQIIGALGFPITACIYLFYSMQKERERNEAQREADRTEHKQEMEKSAAAKQLYLQYNAQNSGQKTK